MERAPILPTLNTNPFQFIALGKNAGANFGSDIDSVGDYNGDGVADFMISSPRYTNSIGELVGLYQIFSGKDYSEIHSIEGMVDGSVTGKLSRLGDVNGDGFADVITVDVSCDGTSPKGLIDGTIRVHSGADNSVLYTISETNQAGFGCTIDAIGDVTGDGIQDILTGAERAVNASSFAAGRANIYSGADGSLVRSFFGVGTEVSYFGTARALGDVNNDGTDDFAIGAHREDVNGFTDAGRIYVHSGADLSLLFTIDGTQEKDLIGDYKLMESAGDFDGDGFDDIIYSSLGSRHEFRTLKAGRVHVLSGKDQSLLYSFTTEVQGDGLGKSVAGDFDFNGDGFKDIAFSAAFHEGSNGVDAGIIYVISGKDQSTLLTMEGEHAGSRFGGKISVAGDVNSDGKDDLIISAIHHQDSSGALDTGKVYLIKGR
jgi:hypothetical protein